MLTQYATRAPMFRGGMPVEYEDAPGSERRAQIMVARQKERRELFAILGAPLYMRASVLPLTGGGHLGPVYGREGQALRWGLWSPHRRVLIDIFSRALPSEEELFTRAEWAKAHEVNYAVVKPGYKLDSETLKEWLDRGSS
jgi:hypothetical protein